MQPTPEQHDAIHIHDKNLIVVAGAGSGKTRVLVERYLQLLENHPDWKLNSLVAITFTREAAFEMRNRVRIALENYVATAQDDATLSRWAQLLAQMDTARIDTIHGLCVTILRSNAAQAGIDPKFEVLDEVNAAILLEDVVSDILDQLETPLTDLFSAYESVKIVESLTQANLINSQIEPVPENPDDLLAMWQDEWSEIVFATRDALLNADITQVVLQTTGYPSDDKLGALYIQYGDYLQQMADSDDAQVIYNLMNDCHRNGAVGNAGSAKAWGSKEAKQEASLQLRALRDFIKNLIDRIGKPLNDLDHETAYLLPLWYQLLTRVQTAYRQHKRDNSLLDFDDLERITANLLQNESVRERYRNAEFKHLLVDEFQDTNKLQWQIIQSLADLEQGGSLFVVGDPKQSIYQFRGADVSVFNFVRDQIANNQAGREVPLSQSFRTHQRLVEQFNALFERLLVRDEASPVKDFEVVLDKHMTAFREESPAQPVIECILLDYNELNEEDYVTNPKTGRKNRIPSDDMRRWEAYEIAQHITQWIDEGREIFDKELKGKRPIQIGDFVILLQSMSNVNLYEDVFKSQGIPFLTVAGRGYYSRQEVWDMLDLLRALHNPADNLSLATVLRSPMFGFSDDMLFALRLIPDDNPDKHDPMPLWLALQYALENQVMGITQNDIHLIDFALLTLSELRMMAGRVTISELIRQALAKTGYLAILTGLPDGARRRGNIEKLLQLAESSGKITLGKFSQYLADLTAREIREGEALLDAQGAVKIMTVHASKGLEFPVVILADASWTRGSAGGAPTIMNDPEYGLSCQVFDENENRYVNGFAHQRNNNLQALKEEAERKRLLYVAATRAQDYLIISGQVTQNRSGNWSTSGWLKQIMEALEMDSMDRAIDQTVPFADDVIRLMMPLQPPPNDVLYADAVTDNNLWDYEADEGDFPPIRPPLIDAIYVQPDAQIGHISATQLADLGGVHYGSDPQQREFYRQRFRRRTLHDVPSRVQDLGADRKPQVSARLIGEIVHEAIQYGRFDLEPKAFEKMLEGYAWQRGLTFEYELEDAVGRSQRLLHRFQQSEVYRWIESAKADHRPLFTELPFIFRTEKRVIHGVIDVLFQEADDTWVLVDYKTSRVQNQDFDNHARRYHLQVGVYAAAVREQLNGIVPQTYIHYIRDGQTVPIPTDAWQSELDKLEHYIGELVASDD